MGLDLHVSTSSLNERSDHNLEKHFRWESIKKFIYLAYSYSSASHNFDIFSKIQHDRVLISEFIILEITMGITYMFMDIFIKHYTKKIDLNQSLNPLLKGINVGCILQSLMWNIILAGDLADSLRIFIAGLHMLPYWSLCRKISRNLTCIPSYRIILQCRNNVKTNLNLTSAHLQYQATYLSDDRSDFTSRLFVITLVWIVSFFIATMTDTFLAKLAKIAFMWRIFSTVFVLVMSFLYTEYLYSAALNQIFDVTAPRMYTSSIDRITFIFRIGLIGEYDFSTMSAHTMIDNAIVMFGIFFTAIALARSVIVRVLYLALRPCVNDDVPINSHYLLFVILPLSSEFMNAQKVFTIYIYTNIMCSLFIYLSMLTLTISKLLHSEFRSVKTVYMVGMLCFLCCGLSYPMAMLPRNKVMGIIQGINLTVLYLGGFKVAIVMWLYGVEKFSTDVQFSLGFKLTQFWTASWRMLPLLTLVFMIHKFYELINKTEKVEMILASAWIVFSFCFVTIIQMKTVVKYIVNNNLVGVLKPSPKYGPPETEERLRRRNFNVLILHRQCHHHCVILDEKYDCNHMPLMFTEQSRLTSTSELSLTNIYEAGPSRKKSSVMLESSRMHLN